MLQVQVLGPLRVVDRDDPATELTPAGNREQLCLATLAIVAPNPVSTERLADELYRDREASDPRNAVQAVVSRLRRALGRSAGAIETTATGYRLVDIALDVDEAQHLIDDAIAAPEAGEAQTFLDRAADLWRGPTLEGLVGDAVDAERHRIDGLRAGAADTVAERQLAAGVDHRLVERLEAAVADDPLREKRWELLMVALYRSGRQAEALRAFQRARSVLADQLGLEPGPDLTSLEQRILAQDPGLTPSPPAPITAAPIEPTPLPSGTVTVLLCDVEGSVRRWEADPVDTATDIALLHDTWHEAIETSGGTVVKSTGDGVLAVFATAAAAIEATVAAQIRQEQTTVSVRAALHTGSVQPVDDDYRGPVVNRCARLLDLANGGQILASATTAELARADLSPSITVRDLGLHWLRDVSEPMPVVQIDSPGLRSAFGPLASHGPARLPRLRGTLHGRDELVAEVVTAVDDNAVVALLGPGGIGKTSLALAAAWQLVDTRPVTFVDLARVTTPAGVAERVVAELALADHDDNRSLVDRIADRLQIGTDLVVIDNAEHLLDAVAALVDHVSSLELKGSFLVTSRRPLGLPGETIIGVPPLALPATDDDLDATSQSPSVKLFLERVRAGQAHHQIPSGLLPVVAHICRRLDGIPLAIELAAGRASLLSVDDIAARLDDQLRLLRQTQSSRERRHRSLEAVVTWSVEQLSPPARDLFERLSVLAGSFAVAGVERITELCGLDVAGVLDHLDELVGASLVVTEARSGRLRMLEPIRQFAAAGLRSRGGEEEARRAHARWIVDLAADAYKRRDSTKAAAVAAVEAEADELVAAIGWLAANGETDLIEAAAFPTSWYFLTHDARAGDRLFAQMLAAVDREREPLVWASAMLGSAVASAAHPHAEIDQDVLDAVAIFDEHDHPEAGVARIAAAFAQNRTDDPTVPLRLLTEAEELVPADDRWATAIVDMAMMTLHGAVLRTDPSSPAVATAIERGRRAATVFRELDDRWALGVTLSELGRIQLASGDLASAEACYLEAVDHFTGTDFHGRHYVLTELGRLASARGEHSRAVDYHDQARELADIDQHPGCIAMSIAGMANALAAKGDTDQAADLYREAIDLMDHHAIIEHGTAEWREELDRILKEN